ncbi:MAG: hypothetical protein ACP5RS_01485 [Thermoplasmata archaeon]
MLDITPEELSDILLYINKTCDNPQWKHAIYEFMTKVINDSRNGMKVSQAIEKNLNQYFTVKEMQGVNNPYKSVYDQVKKSNYIFIIPGNKHSNNLIKNKPGLLKEINLKSDDIEDQYIVYDKSFYLSSRKPEDNKIWMKAIKVLKNSEYEWIWLYAFSKEHVDTDFIKEVTINESEFFWEIVYIIRRYFRVKEYMQFKLNNARFFPRLIQVKEIFIGSIKNTSDLFSLYSEMLSNHVIINKKYSEIIEPIKNIQKERIYSCNLPPYYGNKFYMDPSKNQYNMLQIDFKKNIAIKNLLQLNRDTILNMIERTKKEGKFSIKDYKDQNSKINSLIRKNIIVKAEPEKILKISLKDTCETLHINIDMIKGKTTEYYYLPYEFWNILHEPKKTMVEEGNPRINKWDTVLDKLI